MTSIHPTLHWAVVGLLIGHGLIHQLGFRKAFHLAPPEQLVDDIPKPLGVVWLVTMLVFFVAAGLMIARDDTWRWVTLAAIALSQTVVVAAWRDAKFGTISNVLLLAAVLVALLNAPSS